MDLSGMFPIEKSSIYHLWVEEQGHIRKNKWYLSEKMGYEVSWNFAKYDWEMNHRQKWWDLVKNNQTGFH